LSVTILLEMCQRAAGVQ